MKNKPLIIAHRGGAFLVKFENTIEAFDNALKLGADMIEFDVRKSKDNHLVICHNDNIEGYKISENNYQNILKISERVGFRVPLLEEVIIRYGDKIRLDVELKEDGYESDVIGLIKKYLDYSRFVIKSFDDNLMKRVKEIDSNIKTGLLLGEGNPKKLIRTRMSEIFPQRRIRNAKPDFICPNYKLLKIWRILHTNLHEKEIYVWTVNDKDMIEKMKDKVDAIITDRPDLALKIIV